MKNKMIMIIDDDIHIGNMLDEVLNRAGYDTMRAYSGTEALLLLNTNMSRPDIILLDLMLPGMSGEELLAKISGTPVIVVSAKVDTSNKVKLLMNGASDYITKPFSTDELLARIAVQLRNAAAFGNTVKLEYGDILIDTSTHEVQICKKNIKLTKTEYAILKRLAQNPSQVLTKSQILDLVSEDTPDCAESSLKVHISNLRRKMREAGNKDYIESVWGIGFKLSGNI